MTASQQALALTIGDQDLARLKAIAPSRTEPPTRVDRARMLLAYREEPSFFAVAELSRCIIRLFSAASSGLLPMVR